MLCCLPYGDSHRLGGRDDTVAVHVSQLLPQPPWSDILVVEHGGNGADTRIICGFLQCDELRFHPILRHLPVLLHVSPDATPTDNWLANTIRHTAAEATNPRPGSRSMLPRLTELMFVEILRKYMQGLSADELGWFAALNDPVAGAALKFLHATPAARLERGKLGTASWRITLGAGRTFQALPTSSVRCSPFRA
jgi:hypothetical protein